MLNTLFKSVTFNNPSFSLADLDSLPYASYSERLANYDELESWFTGLALKETQKQGDKEVDIYPMKINPIASACSKHAYALFGEFPDDISGSLVQHKVIISDEKERASAEKIEEFIAKVWHENNGASLMMENGVLSQIFGGCIFKASWIFDEQKIRVERIHPTEFYGEPYSNDFWKLRYAWVIRPITATQASDYGVTVNGNQAFYIEYWTEKEYQIFINDTPMVVNIEDGIQVLGGENPFGFVPFVYIPHQRNGRFYGDSLITDALKGLTKEENLRLADAGDATSDESHSLLAMRYVKGSPQIKKIAKGIAAIDLGGGQNISGGEQTPDLFAVKRSSLSESMLSLGDKLHAEFRREAFVPAVADGEDEGSQRSSATLAARMWSLVSHIKSERVYWSTGLGVLAKMILKIAKNKHIGDINQTDIDMRIKCKWHPILPKDREAVSQEMVSRAGTNLGSPELLLEILGDSDDIQITMDQIKSWLEFKNELEIKKIEAQAKAKLEQTQMQIDAQSEQADKQIEASAEQAKNQHEMSKETMQMQRQNDQSINDRMMENSNRNQKTNKGNQK